MYWNELTWSKQNKTELINSFCPKKFSLMKIQAIPSLADSVFFTPTQLPVIFVNQNEDWW